MQPSTECRIIQIDSDPLKRDIPIWGFTIDLAMHADSVKAMDALSAELARRLSPADRLRVEARRKALGAEHDAQSERWLQRAHHLADQTPIAPEWAAHCLNDILDDTTLIVCEAASNTHVLWNYLRQDTPGSYYESLGSGLGWALGAALGAKMAAPLRSVICVLGDGSWLFSTPMAAYWAAQQHNSPFLTVIFNNEEYFSTAEAILTAARPGAADDEDLCSVCDLPEAGMYSRVAEALGLWARTIDNPAELRDALREGLDQVLQGRCAMVNIRVSSARPRPDAAKF
jgi:acetolactate synthase-1/2/3 large subunit